MSPAALQPTQSERELPKAMHGKSANASHAFFSMLNKNHDAHRVITDEYVQRWSNDEKHKSDEEAREARKSEYMGLVNNYYDLATDFYEEGWAQSFHFCRFAVGEGFLQALARHEHWMAHKLQLGEGMKVLDVGCGVGRPAREIATFSGCSVVGLNNNGYQIERATGYAKKEGLDHLVSFKQGNFMEQNFPAATFDAAYAIEATVHAPSLHDVYARIFAALKPGARFGVYEWVMTDAFDAGNARHQALRLAIERGNGIAHMRPRADADAAMRAAGFVLEEAVDLAAGDSENERERGGGSGAPPPPPPWYYPIAGEWRYARTLWDLLGVVRMSWVGRTAMGCLLRGLEAARLAPAGTRRTGEELAAGAEALVEGGRLGLFTPMYFMVGRKPAEGEGRAGGV